MQLFIQIAVISNKFILDASQLIKKLVNYRLLLTVITQKYEGQISKTFNYITNTVKNYQYRSKFIVETETTLRQKNEVQNQNI